MSGPGAGFPDLTSRTASGVAIAAVGLFAVWWGGELFAALVAAVAGLMIWELTRMIDPGLKPAAIGGIAALAAAAAFVASHSGWPLALAASAAPAAAGLVAVSRFRRIYAGSALFVMLAALGFVVLRALDGPVWMLWLALVVVATDVLGYFAGRRFGGPKFWPRVSPKKTWSGTLAGWAGAAAVGAVFMAVTGVGPELLWMSVATAMAAQAGDLAESAVKRGAGVKDASNILPGHGGLLDRFDGMMGAGLFVLVMHPLAGFPPAAATAAGG